MIDIIKCYSDEACTEELTIRDSSYDLHIGPSYGFDGDDGQQHTQYIYLKNTGEVNVTNIALREMNDTSNYFKYSSKNESYISKTISLPSLAPGESTFVEINAIIPAKVNSTKGKISLVLYYYAGAEKIDINDPTEFIYPARKNKYGSADRPDNLAHVYGFGALTTPLYRQEALIPKSMSLIGVANIGGPVRKFINADYKITRHYTGLEMTIEDIQAAYTWRYMALGCFDGTALPLWLDNEHNEYYDEGYIPEV